MNSIDQKFAQRRFNHGCDDPADLAKIRQQGFRSTFVDEDGRWKRDGNLGVGTYLSCDWKMALWFGFILLEVSLPRGTHLLDTRPAADGGMLQSLRKEFGAELLRTGDVRKTIPHNKHLRRDELVTLVRHFYHLTWDEKWGNDSHGNSRWPAARIEASRGLSRLIGTVRRYRFDGFGDPASDNGIVVFASDKIRLERVVAEIDPMKHSDLIFSDRIHGLTLADLQKLDVSVAKRYSCRLPKL